MSNVAPLLDENQFVAPSVEPRTHRQWNAHDVACLPQFQRNVFNILNRNRNQFVNSATLKFETGTKHAPRRVSEIQSAGFRIEVRKNGSQNEYRLTEEIKINA